MFVCLCYGVTDRKIREIIRSGVSDIKDVQERTSAGANCGSCLCAIESMIRQDKEGGKITVSKDQQQAVRGNRS